MDSKFNLFDLFGYLIPGAIFVILVWAPLSFWGMFPAPDSTWLTTLVGIPIAYACGHLVHQLGQIGDAIIKKTCLKSRLTSVRALTSSDKLFTLDFKKQLISKIKEMFKITLPEAVGEPNDEQSRQIQMAFDLCYDYVIQQGIGAHTDNFLAIRGFYRNTLVGIIVSTLIGTLVFAYQSQTNFSLCCVIAIIWVVVFLIGGLLIKGYVYFGTRFVISVYRSFYVSFNGLQERHKDVERSRG